MSTVCRQLAEAYLVSDEYELLNLAAPDVKGDDTIYSVISFDIRYGNLAIYQNRALAIETSG
ncbi:MAG: hypothetical protein K2X93_09940 [Candidatus Obscuribacterales bacterium]|nr:hypothetical protein [Candidatus Obscuribacterales bacterium]